MLVPSIQKNAAPEVFPSAAHYWKFVFLVCSFPLRRIAVTGSCFLLFYFVFVSRRFPDIRIVYRLVIYALTFFLANRFHCPHDNVLLKAFIVFFSPEAGFTTMASFFLSTKILKKSKTRAKPARLSNFYFNVQAFIFNKTRYEVVFKTTALKLPPFGFFKTVGS